MKGIYPSAKFKDDDIRKLVDDGFGTKAVVVAATKGELAVVFLGRRGVVVVLLKAIVQPIGMFSNSQLFNSGSLEA